ncbi:hypothetical protein F52700_4404 [Fusarium sp. NRRL 52700]|nr:hypothetical protein F52700_4404 [Fusarium sp. NRRL 52700]
MSKNHYTVPHTKARSKRAQYVNQAWASPRHTLIPSAHTTSSDSTAAKGSSRTNTGQLTLTNGETQKAQTMPDTLPSVPEFCGPSSSEFAFEAVSGNLREMGMPSALLSKLNCDNGNLSDIPSRLSNYGPFMKLVAIDPLWDIPKAEAVTLSKKWFTNMGSLYPFLREQELLDTVDRVYAVIEPINAGAWIPRRELAAETILNGETNKLKIVLAISKIRENGGRDDQAQRLFQSTTEAVESLIWNPSGVSGIQLFVLTAIYHYQLDDEDNSDPVLRCLLQWTKLVGTAWRIMNIDGENGADFNGDDLEYLDAQASQWYDHLPQHLKLDACHDQSESFSTSPFIQAALYLRQSLLRNLIFRPVLQSISRINQHKAKAHVALALAKDAIATLCRLSTHRTLIFSHALFFKHLLVAAFGNILLAVVYAHSLFWDTVRMEFDQALDLIELLSIRSPPMLRLWQRLQGLRELPGKLNGLSNPALSSDLQRQPDEDRGMDSSLPGSPTDSIFNSIIAFGSLPGDFTSSSEIGIGIDGFPDFSFLLHEPLE